MVLIKIINWHNAQPDFPRLWCLVFWLCKMQKMCNYTNYQLIFISYVIIPITWLKIKHKKRAYHCSYLYQIFYFLCLPCIKNTPNANTINTTKNHWLFVNHHTNSAWLSCLRYSNINLITEYHHKKTADSCQADHFLLTRRRKKHIRKTIASTSHSNIIERKFVLILNSDHILS